MGFLAPSRPSRADDDGRDGGRPAPAFAPPAADVNREKLSADPVSARSADTQGAGMALARLGFGVACWLSLLCLGTMAGAASASPSMIPSDPLRVIVQHPGQVDAQFTDAPFGEIAGGPDYPNGGPLIATYDASGQPTQMYGWGYSTANFESVQAPVLSGSGAADDPYRMVSVYRAGDLQITETLEAVNGDFGFLARYRLENHGVDARRFRLIVAADLDPGPGYGEPGFSYDDQLHTAADYGVGVRDEAPPSVIGAENDVQGTGGYFIERAGSSWAAFGEGAAGPYSYEPDHPAVLAAPATTGLTDRVEPDRVDDLIAVQWDAHRAVGLPPGGSDTFELEWAFDRWDALSLTTDTASKPHGSTQNISAYAANHAEPLAGSQLRWSVTGANPAAGSAVLDRNGKASFSWTGRNPGADTLTAFVDRNGNGKKDADEADAGGGFSWTGAPSSPPATGTPPPAATRDVIAPLISVLGPRRAKVRKVLRTKLRLSEPARLSARLTVTRSVAKRLRLPRILSHATPTRTTKPGIVELRLPLSSRVRRRLHRTASVRAALKITATDAAGNSRTVTQNLRLTH